MLSTTSTPRHFNKEVAGLKGLLLNIEDTRQLLPGYCRVFEDMVLDMNGNARPRDGYSEWWAATSQRVYLAEMELAENGSWTNGAANTATVKYGYQSRLQAASSTMTRALPATVDLYLGSNYTAANTFINVWMQTSALANIVSISLQIASDAGFVNSESWNVSVGLGQNITTNNVWTKVTKQIGTGTIAGTPNYAAISHVRIVLTLGGACNLFTDEIYVDYTDTSKSFGQGLYEFRKLSNGNRYLLGVFGETIYSDLNEARSPDKILSGRSRNLPHYFETAEDKAHIFNGVDDNLTFTGTTVRKMGYPAATAWVFAAVQAAAGAIADGVYYYAVTFVYGVGSTRHGESSALEGSTFTITIAAGGGTASVDLSAIPVGPVGSGVVARRIYRSRVGAGNLASKFLVGEINDNTTTTFNDALGDSTILVNKEAPLDNGVPPVAKSAIFFEKGMFFGLRDRLYHSRPGNDLDSTPETVSADAVIPLPNAGEFTGFVEFNGNCYVGQRNGIGKVRWIGNFARYEPVLRTKFEGGQATGFIDQNAITVVNNQYILFKDAAGQIWKMLPNEEIIKVSKPIAPLLDDYNDNPNASSLQYYLVDSQTQWQAGTLAATPNLSTTFEAGKLTYNGSAGYVDTAQSFGVNWSGSTSLGDNPSYAGYEYMTTGTYRSFTLQAATAQKFNKLTFHVARKGVIDSSAIGSTSVTLQLRIYKFKYQTGLLSQRGANIINVTASAHNFTGFGFNTLDISFSSVHIPKGEKVLVEVEVVGGEGLFEKANNTSNGNFGLSHVWASDTPTVNPLGDSVPNGNNKYRCFHLGTHSILPSATIQQISNTMDSGGTTLQRWTFFKESLASTNVKLRAGSSVKIWVETSTDDVNWSQRSLIYDATALASATVDMANPIAVENVNFYPWPDYRVDEAFPSGELRRYARFLIEIDPNRQCNPSTDAYSAVSTTEASTFPSLTNPAMSVTRQTSFASPYNKADYLRDIWTSPIVEASSIAAWGRFHVDAVENQQLITYQVRTATSSGGIAAATWFEILPNTVPVSTNIVASATHFQLRAIFQDDPTLQYSDGQYSEIRSMHLTYATSATVAVGPMTTPNLFHYKEYVMGSWPSIGSRINNQTVAFTAFDQSYDPEVQHWFSTWTRVHYSAIATSGNKLLVCPSSGGKVLRARNSDVADDNSSAIYGVTGKIETLPWSIGSSYIKSLHEIQIGMALNFHANGLVARECDRYPAVTLPASSTPQPYFLWYATTGPSTSRNLNAALANFVAQSSYAGFSTFGAVMSTQLFKTLFSHTANADISLAGAPSSDPFVGLPTPKPYQNEWAFALGLQERAFTIGYRMFAIKDSDGNKIFPSLTSFGVEGYIENYRGV